LSLVTQTGRANKPDIYFCINQSFEMTFKLC
jgi:hypothetical protein